MKNKKMKYIGGALTAFVVMTVAQIATTQASWLLFHGEEVPSDMK